MNEQLKLTYQNTKIKGTRLLTPSEFEKNFGELILGKKEKEDCKI
jgi:hypothetical protein